MYTWISIGWSLVSSGSVEIDVAGESVGATELEVEVLVVCLEPKSEANGLPSRDCIEVGDGPDGFARVLGRGGKGGLRIDGGRGGNRRWEEPESVWLSVKVG